jgi:archaellum component FlaC
MDLNHLEEKLDRIVSAINRIDKTLAGQAAQLKEHMRRTELLETQVKPLWNWFQRAKGATVLAGGLLALWEGLKHLWP